MKRLYVIGMGPGGAEQLTPQALRALEDSRVVCGYTTYMDHRGGIQPRGGEDDGCAFRPFW